MPPAHCFCAEIPAIRTRTRLLIVRHCAEISRTSNTGRMVARAVPGTRVVDHGLPGAPLDLTELIGPNSWVLFPGAPPATGPLDVGTLVVLDGTWSQVKGMRWRVPPLDKLPSLSLPAPEIAPLRIRRPSEPNQLATIEAVAAALEIIEGPEPAAQLRRVFDVMARRMRDLRGFDMPGRR
jgi:DTW domain-containing protein YfiP